MSDISMEPGHAAAAHIAASALTGSGHTVANCANCEAPTFGAYCGVCGQERDTHRRSVMGLISAFVEDVISFDSRVLRTVIALLAEPGEMAIAFREGRTMRYVPPLRLYFFVSLLFFLLLSTTHLALVQLEVVATPMKISHDAQGNAYITNPAYDASDPDMKYVPKTIKLGKDASGKLVNRYSFNTKPHFFSRIGIYHSNLSKEEAERLNHLGDGTTVDLSVDNGKKLTEAQKKEAAAKKKQVDGWITKYISGGIKRLAADPAALNEPMTTWIPRALFLLMPLYALLLAAFYWRQRKEYYFVDHLIFSLSIHTFLFVVLMVDAGLAQVMSGEYIGLLTVLALALYLFIAMKRFYAQGWAITTAKYFFISFIYTCFFLLPVLGAVFIISFFGVDIV
ncbi:MAG: DUF3667 domain-containing protein [Rhizomicrobium sp.]